MSGKFKRNATRQQPAGIVGNQQQLPPAPTSEDEYASYAQAIAVLIGQGVPGGIFTDMVHGTSPELIQTAASKSVEECLAWFQETPSAGAILSTTPGFEVFAREFHARACVLYPQSPKVTL